MAKRQGNSAGLLLGAVAVAAGAVVVLRGGLPGLPGGGDGEEPPPGGGDGGDQPTQGVDIVSGGRPEVEINPY